ncbi:MAG: helix-turn-helix transcriptional regulator [Clostridia bacterium]|nr:helix-turn-helix transcriptional regulator [Clostridia bacterium]
MKLSEKIYYCRKKAGLSQDALAEKLEVSRQAVSKWENGEAVPETGKLPGLSKAFGVTIDWLLSEEDPVQEEVRNTPPEEDDGILRGGSSADAWEEQFGTADTDTENRSDWSAQNGASVNALLDRLPGILGRLVRMWGWLAGVYVAIGGAGIAGIGTLAKYMVGKMISMNTMTDPFGGGFGEIQITDQFGNPVSGEMAEVILEEIGPSMGYGGFGGMDTFGQDLLANNPVSILANVMIVVGLAVMIGGIVLAVWLYKMREDKQ